MSKSKLPEQTDSEEVDLGQIFKLIGDAFNRLFNFIGSIFKGLYIVLLMFLIHVYKRTYWYIGAVTLGIIIGFVVDVTSEEEYYANMYIEAKFNSTRQVYEVMKQLHQLAEKDEDTLELANIFHITPFEASSLKGFYIEPDLDENDMVNMYSRFFTQLDSISRLDMTYNNYKKSLTPTNFNIHKIGVVSTDKTIYKKIEKDFIERISGNDYLDELVEANKLNLEKKEEVLLRETKKTDSLLNEYLKIRINESQKELIPGAGTNLYMGNAESNNLIVDESAIIEKILSLEAERREINTLKVTQKTVISVLANFPESGYDIGEWYDKMKFLLPLILVALTLIMFSGIGIGKYLEDESKKAK